MLEMFAPYALFISFLLTVLFNLWLISKNIHWIVIIIANILLIVIMEFLNLAEYNFLNRITNWLFDFIGGILREILEFIGEIIDKIWDSTIGALIDKLKSLIEKLEEWLGVSSGGSGGGGGGGFHSR